VIFNGFTFGQLYLVVILIAVFVCTLAIQGATVRLLFSMGRDRRVPLGGVWAHVNPTLKTPANAGIAVGVLAAVPVLVTGAGGAAVLAISATGLIYLAYFLCNLGVLFARRRGWPHQAAPFSLRSYGTIINVIALVWGGVMIINIGLWTAPDLFGIYGSDLRNTWTNPFINTFLKFFGNPLTDLPAVPVFEATMAVIVVIGALYYLVALRGKVDVTQVAADTATGETAIA